MIKKTMPQKLSSATGRAQKRASRVVFCHIPVANLANVRGTRERLHGKEEEVFIVGLSVSVYTGYEKLERRFGKGGRGYSNFLKYVVRIID